MFANKRQQKICELLEKNGAVTTAELVKNFAVSTETIRRDLMMLEEHSRLQRVHGGAVSFGESKPFLDLMSRNEENHDLKEKLAKTAASFVQNGDSIAIDAGSTAILFAEALKSRLEKLTIVTHCLDVFDLLCRHKEFEVLLIGGHFLRSENAFYGQLASDSLKRLHVNNVFICPSAVSLKNGICDYQLELYQMQRQLLSCGDKVYILSDSSKFEKNALLKVDDMRMSYTYVTDSKLPDELKKLYLENQINIISGGD